MKRDLAALAGREHDLLIVGGGINGAAAVWDAAQRGLSAALVERRDFGAGTSWNSLKTIHGGLRHLQRADIASLRESVRERRALLRIAPELVRPLPFLVPTYGHGRTGREAFAIGLWLNDLLSLDRSRGLGAGHRIGGGRVLSRRDVLWLVPGLAQDRLSGGALWHDAQVSSSERLLMAFLHSAAAAGALLANDAEVVSLLRSRDGVAGARIRDAETGAEHEVRARCVVNAAGPGAGGLLAMAGIHRPPIPLLRAFNLVLRRPVAAALAVGAWSAGRLLFVVPWKDRAILGTAYATADADPAGVTAAFVEDARRAFPWAELAPDDVALVHDGWVPGGDGERGLWTRPRLIDHQREDQVAGLVSMIGVKYTTARALAEQAIDLVAARLGRRAARCRTAITSLTGTRPPAGSLADQVRGAVREEMANRLTDVVLRRLDLGTGGPPDPDQLTVVAGILAGERGWDDARLRDEQQELDAVYEPARRIADTMNGRR